MKIFDFWNKLVIPSNNGSLYARKFSNDIFIGRNTEFDFRLFLVNSSEKSTDFNDYRYINSKYYYNLSLDGVLFESVYFFEIKNEIGIDNIKEFCSFLDVLFDFKHGLSVVDLQHCVESWYKITSKNSYLRNEVIGLWGELFFLKTLLKHFKFDTISLYYIVKSWENENSRALKDFNFKKHALEIEVKTYTGDSRIHKFFTLDQLIPTENYFGYVLSINAFETEIGFTLKEITEEIFELFAEINQPELASEFKMKLKLRGAQNVINSKYSDTIKLQVSGNLNSMSFYEMSKISKPQIDGNIISVSWSTNFESIKPSHQDANWLFEELKNPHC